MKGIYTTILNTVLRAIISSFEFTILAVIAFCIVGLSAVIMGLIFWAVAWGMSFALPAINIGAFATAGAIVGAAGATLEFFFGRK